MRLYVKDKNNKKIYLRKKARSRYELAHKIGSARFTLRGNKYSVNDVKAEADTHDLATGAIIGGVIGLLGGPIGVLTGGTIGGLIGRSSDSDEINQVRTFNKNKLMLNKSRL